MLSFVQYITESNRADLYHGTDVDSAISILKQGKIKHSSNGRTSLSRDRKAVEQGHGHGEAYFVINHNTLRQTHQIRPTDWHMGGNKSFNDKHGDEDSAYQYRDKSMRRSEAEESVRGHIPARHIKELIIHSSRKGHWGGHPETKDEKEIRIENHPLYKGLHYKDRMKRHNDLIKHAARHGIKVTFKDY